MKTICPVCNNLGEFSAACQLCHQPLQDEGRLSDYFGDYSPYLPIDQGKWSNGYPDLTNHVCIHVGWCQHCSREFRVGIQELAAQQIMAADPPPGL